MNIPFERMKKGLIDDEMVDLSIIMKKYLSCFLFSVKIKLN